MRLAGLLATLGKLPEAIAALREVIASDPLSTECWTRLSTIYLGTGQLDLAEAAAKKALEISPEQARASRTLSFVLLLAGRHADALAAFQSSRHELFRLMGVALVEYELGHPDASQRVLDEILSNPAATSASYQIAQVYAWRGEADRAFEWLDRAFAYQRRLARRAGALAPRTGAITFVQRFGGALNLNVHFRLDQGQSCGQCARSMRHTVPSQQQSQ